MYKVIEDEGKRRMSRAKFSKMLVTKKLYKEFKEKYPDYKDMTWVEFFSLWKDIAKTIRIEGATNPLGVRLGSYLGEIKTMYYPGKLKYTPKDYAPVTILKPLTKNKIYKIMWIRRDHVRFNGMLAFYGFNHCPDMGIRSLKFVSANPELVRVARVITYDLNTTYDSISDRISKRNNNNNKQDATIK